MTVKVLGISAGPRVEGNSDLLLRQALAGAESAGAFRLAQCQLAFWAGVCRSFDFRYADIFYGCLRPGKDPY